MSRGLKSDGKSQKSKVRRVAENADTEASKNLGTPSRCGEEGGEELCCRGPKENKPEKFGKRRNGEGGEVFICSPNKFRNTAGVPGFGLPKLSGAETGSNTPRPTAPETTWWRHVTHRTGNSRTSHPPSVAWPSADADAWRARAREMPVNAPTCAPAPSARKHPEASLTALWTATTEPTPLLPPRVRTSVNRNTPCGTPPRCTARCPRTTRASSAGRRNSTQCLEIYARHPGSEKYE